MEKSDVVIVGSGHGGAQAAIALRSQGFTGSITIIGRCREAPYERPPLSKEYLSGEKPFERIYIRPPHFWEERDIALRLGSVVMDVQPQLHTVKLFDGTEIEYGKLIWAAGADPRRLSCAGSNLEGVHSVRDKIDVDRIMAQLESGAKRVVVVGGGYIGLEAAAVLIKLGCEVTLLEALPRVLARVAGEDLSAFYQQQHIEHGVDLRTDASVARIEGKDGKVSRVVLADGEGIDCDMVVMGIGVVPAVGALMTAGAAGANGVDVDEYCRTSLEDIYAIGDCAAHSSRFADGAVVRLESVQNANDMATTVARHIAGEPQPYAAFPWFWSNQYDLKLQTAGLSIGHTATVLRGDPAEKKFSVVYLKDGRVIALDCVNSTKDYVQGRKLVEERVSPDLELLANPDVPLKELL